LPESVGLMLSAHLAAHHAHEVTLPWREPGKNLVTARLIFTSQRGGAVNRNSFNHAWRAALDAAGIPRGRENGYHVLRHTFASSALAAGVDVKTLSEALGHHSAAFTLSVYAHMVKDAPDRMRAALDAMFAQRSQEASPNSSLAAQPFE